MEIIVTAAVMLVATAILFLIFHNQISGFYDALDTRIRAVEQAADGTAATVRAQQDRLADHAPRISAAHESAMAAAPANTGKAAPAPEPSKR
jgi:hypothetical protein